MKHFKQISTLIFICLFLMPSCQVSDNSAIPLTIISIDVRLFKKIYQVATEPESIEKFGVLELIIPADLNSITTFIPSGSNYTRPFAKHPNCWTSDPSIELMDKHIGIKTVSPLRKNIFKHFVDLIIKC